MRLRRHFSSCPGDDDLLRSTSGDLAARKSARVLAHLQQCRVCQQRIRHLTETLDWYRDSYRASQECDGAVVPQLSRFRRRLISEDAARDRRTGRFERLVHAMMIALGIVLGWSRDDGRVSAQTVVSRAIAYERRQVIMSGATPRVRVLARRANRVNEIDDSRAVRNLEIGTQADAHTEDTTLAREAFARLAQYGFDPDRPLSVVTFERWRQSEPGRVDRLVFKSPDLLTISTSAAGQISRGELVVQTETYESVAQSWQFADGLAIEFSMRERSFYRPPHRAAGAGGPIDRVDSAHDLEATELDLRLGLQRLGVTVGRDLHVGRAGDRVRISGRVASKLQLDAIAEYAGRDAAVETALTCCAPSQTVQISPRFERWAAEVFYYDNVGRQFPLVLIASQEALTSKATACADLAQRYTAESARQMSPLATSKLRQLAQMQYRELLLAYRRFEITISPLAGMFRRRVVPDGLPPNWRDRAISARHVSALLDERLHALLAPSESDHSTRFETYARRTLRPPLKQLAEAITGRPVID